MTDLERGPSSDGESAICASSLNNSSPHSRVVERLRFDAVRCELQFSKGVAANIEEAATIISELEAERDRWLNVAKTEADGRARMAALSQSNFERALAAESSLHRVRAETVEECAAAAITLVFSDDSDPWQNGYNEGQEESVNAIRSLKLPDYRGGEAKTAESGGSPSTLNAETE